MVEITQILTDLIRIKTDDNRKSNSEFVNYICHFLAEKHILFEKIPNPDGICDNILAGINVQEFKNINTGLVLSGHMDTVAANPKDWLVDPYDGTLADEVIYGRGTVDMKYFIAVILGSLDKMKKSKLPIFLMFSSDEETDVLGIRQLTSFLTERNIRPQYALIGEPTHFNLCIANRGYEGYTTTIKGISAHSCNPSCGINAGYISAKFISFIEKLNAQYTPQKTTLNVGRITGGEGRNLIPSEVSVDWEIRYNKKHIKDEILAKIDIFQQQLKQSYPGADFLCDVTESLPPFEKKESGLLVTTAKRILKSNNYTLPYATEAGFLQNLGMETLVCGAGDERLAHTAREGISVADLQQYQRFLLKLVRALDQP